MNPLSKRVERGGSHTLESLMSLLLSVSLLGACSGEATVGARGDAGGSTPDGYDDRGWRGS